MTIILESAGALSKAHEGYFLRFGGKSNDLASPAQKKYCYRLHRVWSDGINVRKYKANPNMRPAFVPMERLRNQRVELFTAEEFLKLPE